MYAIVLMLLAQAPDRIVEDIDSPLPSLNGLRAFPWGHQFAAEQDQRHRDHVAWLNRLEESRTVHRDIVQVWRRESDFRAVCWEALGVATDPGKSETARRQALEVLHDLLGEERYYRGIMPRPLPKVDYPALYIPMAMPRVPAGAQ